MLMPIAIRTRKGRRRSAVGMRFALWEATFRVVHGYWVEGRASAPTDGSCRLRRPTMPQHQTPRVSLRALTVGCALSVFLADLILPMGIATSLSYIAVVLLAARSSRWGSPALAALGCTGLTILGWVCALPGSLVWIEVTNRSLGLGALWIAVHLAHRRQGKEEALAQRRIRQMPDVTHAHESLQAEMAA